MTPHETTAARRGFDLGLVFGLKLAGYSLPKIYEILCLHDIDAAFEQSLQLMEEQAQEDGRNEMKIV